MSARKTALCGLLTALAVVVMLLTGAMGIGTFAGPVLAMAVLLPVYAEYGGRAALTAYAATAILGILLVPDVELAWVYAAFGWYPTVRKRIARLPSRMLRFLVRTALCTGVIITLYGLLLRGLGLTADLLDASLAFNLLLLVMGNVVFLLLDTALARLTTLWHHKLRRRFFR